MSNVSGDSDRGQERTVFEPFDDGLAIASEELAAASAEQTSEAIDHGGFLGSNGEVGISPVGVSRGSLPRKCLPTIVKKLRSANLHREFMRSAHNAAAIDSPRIGTAMD